MASGAFSYSYKSGNAFPGAAPGREELPDVYWHLNDQLVALSMAAAVTENLILGTAVTLVAQHDPIWLAKQLATLDFIVRVDLRLASGLMESEEYEAHGHEFSDRYTRTRDNVGIMRALWSQDEASFVGERESLEPSWSWPKPLGIFRCFLAVVVGHVCCRICLSGVMGGCLSEALRAPSLMMLWRSSFG